MTQARRTVIAARKHRSQQAREARYLRIASTRLGRVELHLRALLGDGAVRFHLAGIAREVLA